MSEERARSSYVALLVFVVGLAGFGQFLLWYWDDSGRPTISAPRPKHAPPTRPRSTAPPRSTAVPRPTAAAPSAEELAGLLSSDAPTQWKAVQALRERRMTPELVVALDRCRPAAEHIAGTIDCLKARVPGASLDWIIGRLPSDDESTWPSHMDECVCVLEVLADRVDEAPDRVARAIFPFALSYPARPREPALRGLARTRFDRLPAWAERSIDEGWHSGLAVRAAFALRIEELDPGRVERWVLDTDRKARHSARKELVSSPSPAAARLLARLTVRNREDSELLSYLREREATRHDAMAPLVEIAVDAGEGAEARRSSLELLGQYGRAEHLAPLASLQSDGDPVLRAYADAAAALIEKRARGAGHNRP